MYFFDFRIVIIKKGEIVEVKFYGELRFIKRCFDDNKDDDKGDDKKFKG